MVKGCAAPTRCARQRGGISSSYKQRPWFFSCLTCSAFDVRLLFCNTSPCLHPSTAGATSSVRSKSCTSDMSRAVSWRSSTSNPPKRLRDPHRTNSAALSHRNIAMRSNVVPVPKPPVLSSRVAALLSVRFMFAPHHHCHCSHPMAPHAPNMLK